MNKKAIVGVLFFCLIVSISYIGAQSIAADKNESLEAAKFIAPAILVRGPVKTRNFPLIYPNAMEYWQGNYRYLESEIIVSFTRTNILIPDEWASLTCNKLKGFSPDNESFFYTDAQWSVLFQFSPDISADCVFINTFITRLKYFLRDTSPHDPPLLPAILEIR
ncbi:MAG: hypothetical protein KAH95_05525 [Spirochaetales bacterium]|nr:hypothetical protein [Spirochaetales bacterium]